MLTGFDTPLPTHFVVPHIPLPAIGIALVNPANKATPSTP